MRDGERRVVITGMGAVTPIGNDVASFWDGLVNGRSGIGPITLFDPVNVPSKIAGEVRGFAVAAAAVARDRGEQHLLERAGK